MSVEVEHVGGKWDGSRETRILMPNETLARIVESAGHSPYTDPEPPLLPWLVHEYFIEDDGQHVKFVYRGTRASAVRG